MSELLDSLLETETSISISKEEKRPMSITEETPPPITRNLTPMSNLLESLLKVMLLAMMLNVLLIEENAKMLGITADDERDSQTQLCILFVQ